MTPETGERAIPGKKLGAQVGMPRSAVPPGTDDTILTNRCGRDTREPMMG